MIKVFLEAVLTLSTQKTSRGEMVIPTFPLLFRDAPPKRLGSAIRALFEGNLILDESLASLFKSRAATANSLTEQLTARETEVLQQLALGLSNKELAQRLGMSEHTAKFHVTAVLDKLGARNRADAVSIILREGLVAL